MCDNRFYFCKHCGNIVGMIRSSGVPIICCGEPMTELIAGSVEASHEKHIPVVTRHGNIVSVEIGSVAHPMVAEHFIMWVYMQTKHGGQRKCLKPGDAPSVTFALDGDEAVAVYAYCNLHGLWKTEL